jgi:hypothetical protein
MNVSARSQIERLKFAGSGINVSCCGYPLRVAISANISASIFSSFFGCDDGNPIISHMNVYKPKERLLTTQRKDGKILWCMFIWGCKRVFEKSRFCHISSTMFSHSGFQTAGANPGPCTMSLDLPGLFKHPLRMVPRLHLEAVPECRAGPSATSESLARQLFS